MSINIVEMIGSNDTSFTGILLFRLLLAGFLGAIIGFDRAYHAKEAGIRTHFLVAMGSALFMILSQHGFQDCLQLSALGEIKYDGSRLAQQIVSGIGFLGAGSIVFQKRNVQGLTTAAGIWTVAGVGMAVGGGLYIPAIAVALLTLIALEFFKRYFKCLQMKNMEICFSLPKNNREGTDIVLNLLKAKKIMVLAFSCDDSGDLLIVDLTVRVNGDSGWENQLFSDLCSINGLCMKKYE